MMVNADQEAYDKMERDVLLSTEDINVEGTVFHSSNRGNRPSATEYYKFFMAMGAFGLLLWGGSRIVSYYALWMPVLEDYNYDSFRYSQAIERYAEILYAADTWGLFLAIVAIIGVLTLIVNELYR